MKRTFFAAVSALGLAATGLLPATAASTHTYVPAPYTPVGESWVSVADNLKTYLVASDYGSYDEEFDDHAIGYLPLGSSCTFNGGEILEGPSLVIDDDSECYEMAAGGEGTGIPIGFDINFGGTNRSSVFLTTNGAISFTENDFYDDMLHEVALDDQDSGISVLGNDLGVFLGGYSAEKAPTVVWTAQTTIGSREAFVISWENLSSHGNSNLQASIQLVLLNDGNGDFTAWFNYDKFEVNDQGAPGPGVYSNLTKPISEGVYKAYSLAGWEAAGNSGVENCYYLDFEDGDVYSPDGEDTFSTPSTVKIIDATTKAVSFFDDSNCETPYVFDEGSTHLVANIDGNSIDYLPIGWFYNTSDGNGGAEVSATELFYNIEIDTLVDTGSDPIINKSINTDVRGRFVIGMKGGKTTGDNNDPAPTADCVAPKQPTTLNYKDGNNVVGATVAKALKRYAKAVAKSGCKNITIKVHMLKPTPGGKGVWKKWENQTLIRAREVKEVLKAELKKLDVTDVQIKAIGEGGTDKLGFANDNNRIRLVVKG